VKEAAETVRELESLGYTIRAEDGKIRYHRSDQLVASPAGASPAGASPAGASPAGASPAGASPAGALLAELKARKADALAYLDIRARVMRQAEEQRGEAGELAGMVRVIPAGGPAGASWLELWATPEHEIEYQVEHAPRVGGDKRPAARMESAPARR